MKDQWDDPAFAKQWDHTSLVGNPTREEQLDILLSLLEYLYKPGTAILDLGIGSGLVEEMLLTRLPDAEVIGVESSSAMIELAEQRFRSLERPPVIIQHDLAHIQGLVLPEKTYHVVISIQAMHHLPHKQQEEVFKIVHQLLTEDGIFLLLDGIAVDADHFSTLYKSMWERLERVSKIKSGWSSDSFLERLQHKEDDPMQLEEMLKSLQAAGFYASCLHMHLNRALVAGVK